MGGVSLGAANYNKDLIKWLNVKWLLTKVVYKCTYLKRYCLGQMEMSWCK